MMARSGKSDAGRQCCKGTMVFIVGPVAFLFAMVMQAGMLKIPNARLTPWTVRMNSIMDNTIHPPSAISVQRGSVDPDHTCMSRLQHMLHRPSAQTIPPSPVFIDALVTYEKHHANCFRSTEGNWTKAFLRSQAKSDGDENLEDHHDGGCKYVVHLESGAGMGNRLMSLVSAVTYAILTNRIILLSSGDVKGHVAKILCDPFEYSNSTWVLPEDFPPDLLGAAPRLSKAVEEDFKNMTVVGLQLEHNDDSEFFCAKTRKGLESVPWIVYNSNQYHLPRLFTFPEFWSQLVLMFPDPSRAFTYVSRHFLLPKNLIWEKIVRIHDSYLASTDSMVGIQIRRHSKPSEDPDFSDRAMDRILSCLVSHRLIPNATSSGGLSKQMLERMDGKASASVLSTDFTKKWTGRMSQQGGDQLNGEKKTMKYAEGVTSVLVVSLEQKYAQAMEDLYTNNPTVDGRLVRVHMVSHEGSEWHTIDQDTKAFIEMWLLSLCDDIATSAWSTFGYVAQGLGAIRPYILGLKGDLSEDGSNERRLDLDPLQDTTIPHLHCALGQSSDPCNHFPFYPKLTCGEEEALGHTPEHGEWLRKHLLTCQDEVKGRQLVL